MTAVLFVAVGAALALLAVAAATRAGLPSGRTVGGALLLIAAMGLAALRQFVIAVPVGLLGVELLRQSLAAARATPRPGQSSEVRSDALAMRLDHDTGAMDGEVLTGRFAGAQLSELSAEDLQALAAELDADPDSLGLLLAYLDRRGGRDPGGAEPPPGEAAREMAEAEALRILGLAPGASAEDVRAAHRRLIKKVHPDLGGSDALAALLNAAKARLDP